MGGSRMAGVGSVVRLTAAAQEAAEQTAPAQGLSPTAIPFEPNLEQESQARTQAEGPGRAPPGARAPAAREELRRLLNGGASEHKTLRSE